MHFYCCYGYDILVRLIIDHAYLTTTRIYHNHLTHKYHVKVKHSKTPVAYILIDFHEENN